MTMVAKILNKIEYKSLLKIFFTKTKVEFILEIQR